MEISPEHYTDIPLTKREEEYLNIFLTRRDDDSIDGCVSCPTPSPSCNCSGGKSCIMTSRTCQKCASVKCVGGSSSSSSKNIGGIIGGVVGGVVFLGLIIGFIVWNHKKHRKSNKFLRLEAQEKEILAGNGYNDGTGQGYSGNNSNEIAKEFSAPPQFGKSPGDSSSIYTGFSKRTSRRTKRNSAATFTSLASSALTRASNIIPIAYIPGVKVRSDSSLFSNRQVTDDVQSIASHQQNNHNNTTFGSPLSTMTAVRAVPKLVDVNKSKLHNEVIFESDEDEDVRTIDSSHEDNANYNYHNQDHAKSSASSSQQMHSRQPSFKGSLSREEVRKNRKSIPGLTHIVEPATDGLSDVNELISLGSDSDDDQSFFNRHHEQYGTSNNRYSNASSVTPDALRNRPSMNNRPSSSILLDVKVDQSPLNPFDDSFEHR